MDDYIIYEVKHNNKVVYIGSGKPHRMLHVKSGKSHVVELNRLFFTDYENVNVEIIREGLTKEESLELEKDYIQAYEPVYNTQHTKRSRKVKHRNFFK